jgi:parvulin-like peptidyl-prolyl isomerase
MTTRWRSWVGLALVAFLAGCQKGPAEDAVLVRVGGQAITLGEFQRAFDEAVTRHDGIKADSSSARTFLRDYVNKTLLEQVAADSLEWAPLLEHRAISFQENLMVQKLRRDAYGHAAELNEQELRKIYEKARTAYRYRELPCPTREDALQKLATVREGAAFARMVEHTGAAADGSASWRTALDVPESIIDVLAGLGIEQVGGPVESDGKYWLVQLLEKSDNPSLPPFEDVERSLRMNAARERGGRLLRAFRDELKTKYLYEPRMATVLWMTEFLHDHTRDVPRTYTPPTGEPDPITGLPTSTEVPVWTSNPLSKEESARIIATTTADTISAVEFLDHVDTKPSFTWPMFEKPDDVMRLLEELVISRLEVHEAWARGYDKDPDVVWASEKNRKLILTRQFVRQHIYERAAPTVEEGRAWYEKQPQAGATAGRRRYLMVEVATRDLADQAAKILADVADPTAAYDRIHALDPSASWLGPHGFTVTENTTSGDLDREVFRLPKGGVTQPHAAGARFTVARVEEILAVSRQPQPFDEVKAKVMEQLIEARIDSVLNRYLEERRQIAPVEVDEKVFKMIRYDAAAPPATSAPRSRG